MSLLLIVEDEETLRTAEAKFLIGCSGYGRVLARLLQLESPTVLGPRMAVFSHFDALFQRNGFRRVDEEPGEAEGERHVAKARYARGSQAPTLTWQTGAANTWLVTFDRAHAR